MSNEQALPKDSLFEMGEDLRSGNVHSECVFCGGIPLTKQHIIGDWTKKIIPPNSDKFLHSVNLNTVNEETGELIHIPFAKGKQTGNGSWSSQRIKCVCAKCNNEWMNDLEKPVMWYIEYLALSPINSPIKSIKGNLLLPWMALVTIIIKQMDAVTSAFPSERCFEFKRDKMPGSDWKMWIGIIEGESFRNAWHSSFPSQDDNIPDSAFCCWCIGKVAFLTFHTGNSSKMETVSNTVPLYGFREVVRNSNFFIKFNPTMTNVFFGELLINKLKMLVGLTRVNSLTAFDWFTFNECNENPTNKSDGRFGEG
ncbi:MAG: hypothetical protein EON58_04000 [Alphaproteobacteria bacterium]|nr:MAG: hypothetical protein EON58_04000 [Alphaproteobacteria bacterium]